jgi:hypothetical protein
MELSRVQSMFFYLADDGGHNGATVLLLQGMGRTTESMDSKL